MTFAHAFSNFSRLFISEAAEGAQGSRGAATASAESSSARTQGARVAALRGRLRTTRCAALGVTVAVLGMAWSPGVASADYEQVPEHFGASGQAEQLQRAIAIAVNETGAGGVQAGSFYVVGYNARVLRFAPGEEGEEPRFEEAWGWGIAQGGGENEFVRCGPAVAAHPECKAPPASGVAPFGGEEPGHFEFLMGVAVDQATGYVYVLNRHTSHREHHLVEVFTATGAPVGEGFGDAGRMSPAPPESIDEGPEKLHERFPTSNGLAVDEAGTVYVTDTDYSGAANRRARVMSFNPEAPGDYEHYVYTGQSNDIVSNYERPFWRLSLVGGNRLVTAGSELIREYNLKGGSAPTCSRSVSGQLQAMTANPLTGEVFYFTFANRSIHRLGPCDESTEEFQELQEAVKPEPETKTMYALAINAGLAWGPQRPPGALYAADGEEHASQLGIGDILVPAEVFPPVIESESVANTTTESTTLKAKINPSGFTTSYRFEYLSEAAYLANGSSFAGPYPPAFAPAVGTGQIGGGEPKIVAATISSLASGTSYRFRVVATSECEGSAEPLCEAVGAVAAFRTFTPAAAAPPDGRGYELVSPAEKHGGEVFPAAPHLSSCGFYCKPPGEGITSVFPMQSTPGGNAVAYMGFPFSPTEGASVFNSYISRRASAGWQTTPMSPVPLQTKGGEDLAFDAQLNTGTISQASPPLAFSAPLGYANIYLQNAASPTVLTPLLSTPPPNRDTGTFVLEYAGAAPDFSRQFFAANDALTGASAFAPAAPDPGSAGRELYEWRSGHLALVNVLPGNAVVAAGAEFASASPDAHAISDNGRRVYWQTSATVYVREDGQITREVTHPGTFLTASADGLRVLLSDGCLYSLQTEACIDLSQGEGGFQGIAGQSRDLSRIYFVDTAVLPGSGENQRGAKAQGGERNLYFYRQGGGTRFVATLLASDNASGAAGVKDWAAAPGERTAQSDPSGRFLVFGSTAQLTGYDNVGPCEEPSQGVIVDGPCTEVFVYDSAVGALTCPSCNPTGEAPLGNSTLRQIEGAEAWLPQPRYLSNSGRLFFDSGDRLSPHDTNGRVEDVYESEPGGLGSCASPGGCVSLISPGTGTVDSNFLAADSSGANVFFTTRERLVPADVDHLIDLYDAREGGGFPEEDEATPGPCQGESCQPPTASPPASPAPGSQSYQGPGNPKPESHRCAKGKVKKNGRCVRKAHHKKHKRHHKSRGHGKKAKKHGKGKKAKRAHAHRNNRNRGDRR